MYDYVETMRQYFSDHTPNFARCNAESLLDILFCCYCQRSGADPAEIQAAFQPINQLLDTLSFQDSDALFSHICNLCNTYQQKAFREGLLVGFRLHSELSEHSSK